MPFDGLVLKAIKAELGRKILNSRIDRIFQPSPEAIVFNLRSPGERLRLLISAHAEHSRIHLTEQNYKNPLSPPLFCTILRKHVEGGRVRDLTQNNLERVLFLDIEVYDDLGRCSAKRLYCEFMGKHSNIILVDPGTGFIIDGIKRYSHAVSRHREVLPGRPYLPPPEQNKLNLATSSEDDFRRALATFPLSADVEKTLQRILGGLSTTMSREIIFRAGLPPDIKLEHCGEYELRLLWRNSKEIHDLAEEKRFRPALIMNAQGEPLEFAAFELTHFQNCRIFSGSINNITDRFFAMKTDTALLNKEKQALLRLIRKETKRLGKKLDLQENSVSTSLKSLKYQLYGELLTANLYRLNKGLKEAVLEDYNKERQETVSIPLDPSLSPVENAQKYFKLYTKAKKTLENSRRQALATRDELDYLLGVETALVYCDCISEIEEIKQELAKQGFYRPALREKQDKRKEKPQPLKYVSSDGFTILVGKNNRQNDYLTMKLAQDQDIWLHTKEIPGSHVLIRANGKPVPESTLVEAAALSAYYSRARWSQNVPVDYTLRKNTRKPPGARPGYITYDGHKTLFVNPAKAPLDNLSSNVE